MNSYTYMHNRKVLNDNLMKRRLITATAGIKTLVFYQIVAKQNAYGIKPTLTVTSLDINKNATWAH